MTLEEVCNKYGYTNPSSFKKNFAREKKKILKEYGIELTKYGRGDQTYYIEEDSINKKALTLFEETKDVVVIDGDNISTKYYFYIMLAIAATPQCVFRGTYANMLIYLGVSPTEKAVSALKEALKELEATNIIIYKEDKSTSEDYFIAAFYRAIEKQVEVSIKTIRVIKELADNNGVSQWITLLRTLIAIEQAIAASDVFTMEQLKELSGLSEPTLRKYRDILSQNNIISTSKAFAAFNICLGQTAALNGFIVE